MITKPPKIFGPPSATAFAAKKPASPKAIPGAQRSRDPERRRIGDLRLRKRDATRRCSMAQYHHGKIWENDIYDMYDGKICSWEI